MSSSADATRFESMELYNSNRTLKDHVDAYVIRSVRACAQGVHAKVDTHVKTDCYSAFSGALYQMPKYNIHLRTKFTDLMKLCKTFEWCGEIGVAGRAQVKKPTYDAITSDYNSHLYSKFIMDDFKKQ